MITIVVRGRLGNQLYFYALAKALEKRLGIKTRLNTQAYLRQKEGFTNKDLEIFSLNINKEFFLEPNPYGGGGGEPFCKH